MLRRENARNACVQLVSYWRTCTFSQSENLIKRLCQHLTFLKNYDKLLTVISSDHQLSLWWISLLLLCWMSDFLSILCQNGYITKYKQWLCWDIRTFHFQFAFYILNTLIFLVLTLNATLGQILCGASGNPEHNSGPDFQSRRVKTRELLGVSLFAIFSALIPSCVRGLYVLLVAGYWM